MAKIITQFIYRKQGNNPQLLQELTTLKQQLVQLKKDKKIADQVFRRLAQKLNIAKTDPDYTYEGIYQKLAPKLTQ